MSEEYRKSIDQAKKSYEEGFRPDIDTLYGQLEDSLENAEKIGAKVISYEEFQTTKRFLDSLEEK